MQEMVIYGVSFDMVGKQPIVLLKAVDTNKFLPIWIGHPEAAAILMKLQGASTPRPMTHDLLSDVLDQMEAKCDRVSVTETCVHLTSSSPSTSTMRSWVIGRGVVAPWSFIRIAAASGWPIQIGRNLFPSRVLSRTIGCLPTMSKLTP